MVAIWLRRGDRTQKQLRDEEVNRRLRGRSEIEQELRVARAERVEVLARLEMADTPEAEERLRLEEAHVAEIDQRRARLGGLIGEEPLDALPGRRDTAALEVEQKTSALDALGPIAREPRARERLEVEVVDAERSLERARDDEATARARVEQNPVDAEEVAGLSERLASWTEELAALSRRERVYARTLAEINAAEQATMQLATRYLERHMVRDIATITGGRYRRIRVDDTNLGIEVFAPERKDWVPGHGPVPGHARHRLPGRAPRARAPGDGRPAPAPGPGRPVRDPGRHARAALRWACSGTSPRTSR